LAIVGAVNDRRYAAGMPTNRLAGRVLWLVGRVSLHGQRLVHRHFAEHDLRKQHYGVLRSLADVGPAAQGPLADRVGLDRSDMVSLVDELEAAGHVRRNPDPTDRRRKIVTITAAGEAVLDELHALVSAADDELLGPLSDAERRTLVELLTRILPPADRARGT
jgi:MarR family transcriptional regulator, lower aerobic nicotinate degradation pathway regulator